MQANKARQPSITEIARREQIVTSTIAVIAEVGLAKASFAKIAENAGLSSTSLISYHFAGRADLVDTVAERVRTAFAEHVTARQDHSTPMRTLLSFCEASVDFIGTHPAEVSVLRQIYAAASRTDKSGTDLVSDDLERLSALFLEGQRNGSFRDFDPVTMAHFILALRDATIRRFVADPGLDLSRCGHELVDLVERATRKETS